MSAIVACDTERNPPPPTPWSVRAAISCGIVCDSAQNTEAATKSAIDTSRIGRRP